MKLIGYFKFTTTLFLLGFMLTEIARAESLQEAVQLALRNNPFINAQKEELVRWDLQSQAVWRSTLPKVDFDASYRHVTDVAEIQMPIPPAGKTVRLGAFDSYETGVTASYVLFSGFAHKNNVRLSEQQVALNRSLLGKSEKDIAFQTIAAYHQVQNAQLELASLQSAQKRALLQFDRVKSLERQGMALALDTLSLALSKLNYEQKIIAAQAALETAQQQLTNLTGVELNVEEVSPDEPIGKLSELSLEQIEDIKNIRLQEKIASLNRSLVQANYYPKVALQASMKYGRPGLDMVKNDWMLYGVWGVGISWNLFSFGSDHLQAQAQEAAVRRTQFQRQAVGDQFQTRYDNARRELNALQEQLRVIRTALRVAQDKMKIIDSQYRQGMATVNDFNDTNLELAEAEINHLRQLIRLAIKINEIDYLSGQPINDWSVK